MLIILDESWTWDNLYNKPGLHVVSKVFSMSKNTVTVAILLMKLKVTWAATQCSVPHVCGNCSVWFLWQPMERTTGVQGPLGSHYMVPVSESYMPSSTKENFIFFLLKYSIKSRDSSVVIELGNGLDDRGSRVRLPVGAGNFSLHHHVQNGSVAHSASYTMGTRSSFPGG